MSGALPATPLPSEVEISQVTATLRSRAQSLRVKTIGRGAQRWRLRLLWEPLTRDEAQPLFAFLCRQEGPAEKFTVQLPWWGRPMGAGSASTGRTASLIAAGQASATLENLDASATVLREGDYFKFSDHAKVYQAAADWSTDGAGAVAASWYPALVEDVEALSTLTLADVPFQVSLEDDELGVGLRLVEVFGLDLRLIERL